MMIRAEQPGDRAAIHQLNAAAFGRANEANLVDRLRGLPSMLSLVAVESVEIVGHLFFSPVMVEGWDADKAPLMGLGPVAVHPRCQGRGVGTQLITWGLERCAQQRVKAVVVLGDPNFYARFGFVPAYTKGLTCEFIAPEEAFRVLELASSFLEGYQGQVKYRPEFRDCE